MGYRPGVFARVYSALQNAEISDELSDMRKISSRDFQKRFAEITSHLKNGQAIEITRHGKTIGRFTKMNGKKLKNAGFLG